MIYRVNIDFPTRRTTIHKSDCTYAQVREKQPEDGYWCRFQDVPLGEMAAQVEEQSPDTHEIAGCNVCKPPW